jgi:hypothetical protein
VLIKGNPAALKAYRAHKLKALEKTAEQRKAEGRRKAQVNSAEAKQ